jgi:hypothetical protein
MSTDVFESVLHLVGYLNILLYDIADSDVSGSAECSQQVPLHPASSGKSQARISMAEMRGSGARRVLH